MPGTLEVEARVLGVYGQPGDPAFAAVLAAAQGPGPGGPNDDALADLIERDARERLDRGLPVTLERYLLAVPGLASRRVPLDAAIEFALRWAVRRGGSEESAARDLAAAYPQLAHAVLVAVELSHGIASTRAVAGGRAGRTALPVPSDFGPPGPGGRPRYDLRQRLGGGAQGDVYLAADRALADPDRPAMVAIKCLPGGLAGAEARAALEQEGRRARRIEHPHVVRVLDRGTDPAGGDYVVYEYVDGGDLAAALAAAEGRLPPRRAAELVAQIAEGVQAAHVAGVVHSDLKPSNVVLTRAGVPKVADFGAGARLAPGAEPTGGAAGGNLAFIAPEQLRGEEGARAATADVYALGGLLYHLITGEVPGGRTAAEVTAWHQAGAPAPSLPDRGRQGIDADLDAVCRRAMDPEPSRRHQSAESLASDLRAWLARRPIEWTSPRLRRRAALFARRSPGTAAAVLAAVLALALGTGAAVYVAMAARDRRLQDQIASLRQIDAERARAHEDAVQAMESLSLILKRNKEFSGDWFPTMTVLEAVSGPVLFDPYAPKDGRRPDLWRDRVEAVRSMVDAETAVGRGSTVETAMWLDALAFWALRAEDAAAAERALAEGDAAWGNKLSPEDPWRALRGGLRACAKVRTAAQAAEARGRDAPLPPREAGPLRQLGADIERAIAGLGPMDSRKTARSLLETHLARLYAEDLLDDPDRAELERSRVLPAKRSRKRGELPSSKM